MIKNGMNVEWLSGAVVFDRLFGEWDELAGRGMTTTPFQSLAYQRSWWTHLGVGELITLTARDESQGLLGIGCFYLHEGTLYFNGCTEETDYLDLISSSAHAPKVWASFLQAMIAAHFPSWSAMDLCNIPAGSPTRSILKEYADAQSWSRQETVHEVCPVISLPETFEDYLGGLDKKQRHEIRRKMRRADSAGVETRMVRPEDDLPAAVNAFLDLLRMSSPEKADWLDPGREALFHEVAAAAQTAGTLQLIFLQVEDQPAAALFNFDYQERIWVYNSGMNMDTYAYLSPGVVLTARAIELAIASGRTAFDFLRGDEPYKYRFGAQDTTIYRLQIQK